jgi:hypothetical protein
MIHAFLTPTWKKLTIQVFVFLPLLLFYFFPSYDREISPCPPLPFPLPGNQPEPDIFTIHNLLLFIGGHRFQFCGVVPDSYDRAIDALYITLFIVLLIFSYFLACIILEVLYKVNNLRSKDKNK